jgi:hypothetical protein
MGKISEEGLPPNATLGLALLSGTYEVGTPGSAVRAPFFLKPEDGGVQIPADFGPWTASDPFTAHVGTLFTRLDIGGPVFGTRMQALNRNGQGVAHGGFIATQAVIWGGAAPCRRPPSPWSAPDLPCSHRPLQV